MAEHLSKLPMVQTGVSNYVEEKLKAKLPKSSLRAQAHISSQLCHFTGAVHDMVVAGYTSGFGWDLETKSMVAEKEVWKAYVKATISDSSYFVFLFLFSDCP